jgi:hypothetical protein
MLYIRRREFIWGLRQRVQQNQRSEPFVFIEQPQHGAQRLRS